MKNRSLKIDTPFDVVDEWLLTIVDSLRALALTAMHAETENDEPFTQELVCLSNQAATIAARRRQARDDAMLTT